MAESAGKPQASKSKTEKAKVEKNKAEKSDTLRAASVKGGSSRRNAGIKAESGSKADNTAQGNTCLLYTSPYLALLTGGTG